MGPFRIFSRPAGMKPTLRGRNLSRSSTSILSVGLIGIVGAWAYCGYRNKTKYVGTENYAIEYPKDLPGWQTLPNTPSSLFIFRDAKDDLTLRGSVSQVISDVNPTPDLNTNGIAKYYIDRTHENMANWTAQRSPDLPGGNISFSVILRQRKERTVITAFAVKGNTTLMVSVASPITTQSEVQKAMASLAACVKLISLKQSDMGGGEKSSPDYRGLPAG